MSIPNRSRDLNPDDRAARLQLMADLRQLRLSLGLSHRDVAVQVGVGTRTAIQRVERRTNWEISTVQKLARIYRRRLAIDICGVEVPDDGDPVADVYARMRPASAAKQDELARAALVNDLVRIRRGHGWSYDDMGCRLGVGVSAVRGFEQCAPGINVAPVQRYTRVLEGWLGFRLQPVAAAVELAGVA